MYMTFVKPKTKPNSTQMNVFQQFLLGNLIEEYPEQEAPEYSKITISKPKVEFNNFFNTHIQPGWLNIPAPPDWPVEELHQHYNSFTIPKKSGGLRQIDAPDDDLKAYLYQLKDYFERTLKILPHDAAHAYVKERSVVTDLQVHQRNESKWFLKIDLKDFFPSHNLGYVMRTLEKIYPVGVLMGFDEYTNRLRNALKYAFLDDKLPQGTPLSPLLTNILMMENDYLIQHMLWNEKNRFVYTRYADDITISSPYDFDWHDIQNKIRVIFEENHIPFRIKDEKTRYGSSAGRNWNFGIMLNKDNRLTIGHKQNQRFRAALYNLMRDYTNGIKWSIQDRRLLGGQIAWYKGVDPNYTSQVIHRYEEKFNLSLKRILTEPEI